MIYTLFNILLYTYLIGTFVCFMFMYSKLILNNNNITMNTGNHSIEEITEKLQMSTVLMQIGVLLAYSFLLWLPTMCSLVVKVTFGK